MSDSKGNASTSRKFRVRSRIGKYRVEACLAEGVYSNVYRAFDTIERRHVALKIPHRDLATKEYLEGFQNEVRLSAKIDHKCILAIKDASYIDGHFVMAYPLGIETLTSRLSRRVSNGTLAQFLLDAIEGLASVHAHHVIHCDIKPDNFIIFSGPVLKLADLGIARFSLRTVCGSGSGTLGHMAPEQAFGKPSARSDVFALGLVLYRMVAGTLPEYPFDWPPRGFDRLRGRAHPDFVEIIRTCLHVPPKLRFADGVQLAAAYHSLKNPPLR
ncbi:MAG: serine/threonine-protein kinase [Verrucomicrobiales bacterium]